MNVPFPFRVAAGAIAVGLDRLRTLPADLPALSVSLAGHALRASMRVQQELAELAARGEEVLSPLTDRPEEHPAWAHFDDEDEMDDAPEDDPAGAPVDETGVDEAAADAAAADDPGEDGDAAGPAEPEAPVASSAVGGTVDGAPDGAAALPGYRELSVAQLRARLRSLDEMKVAILLDVERNGLARAAFVTTLQNRLTSLRSSPTLTTTAGRDNGGKRA